jgi:DNA-3-methyladenine glycosylase
MKSKISKNFFQRKADLVARDILGKILIRKLKGKILKAKIVETEAYFDENDPASRACKNGDLRETMQMKPGTILVYGVHNNWLINFVTGKEKEASAVLIRALQPLNFNYNCSGPGLLTKSLQINKEFHKKDLLNCNNLILEESKKLEDFDIVSSRRIGIKKDLLQNLRFYIKDNQFISKK